MIGQTTPFDRASPANDNIINKGQSLQLDSLLPDANK
jgi:hypothetical protein